jgi:uncharacterized membrane protein
MMKNKRIFEIDFFKVIALILMIIFHTIYDLNEFVNIDLDYTSGLWYYIGKISAILFIFLAGINSGFSHNPLKRGIMVLSCGMIVTFTTFIFMNDLYVRFGILHFLGVSMILFPLLKRINNVILFLIAILIIVLSNIEIFNNMNLIVFLRNTFGSMSIDYYPLFPYLSIFIFGILAYKLFYYKRKSILKLNTQSKLLYMISKYSLLIYLVHQLIILSIIFLLLNIQLS